MASINLSSFAGAGAQFFDNNGAPLVGGLLYVYTAGTTTPATTYTSPSGTVSNTNPIVLDSAGRTPNEVWVNGGVLYKFVLKSSTSVTIGTYDNIPSIDDPTAFNNIITVTGTNTLLGTSTPPNTAYARGMTLSFAVVNTNTGAVTIDVDGLGAKEITFSGSTPLIAGQMTAGAIVTIEYDGTRFQLMNSSGALAIIASSINGGQIAGFRNKIINGNFDFWQRATSYSGVGSGNTTNAYGVVAADRLWAQAFSGSSGSGTTNVSVVQQAFTQGQTTVPGEPRYFARMQASAIGTQGGTGSVIRAAQKIESVRTFAGQTTTLSFWAKADTTRTYAVILSQEFGTGGSPSATVAAGQSTFVVTTSWQKFTFTFAVPSISGKTIGSNSDDYLAVNFVLYKQDNTIFNDTLGPIGTWSITPYLDLAQYQLEPGAIPTPFEFRLYGTELTLCQRYYCSVPGSNGTAYASAGGQKAGFPVYWPVTMRAAPTIVLTGSITPTNTATESLFNTSTGGTKYEIAAVAAGQFWVDGRILNASAEL